MSTTTETTSENIELSFDDLFSLRHVIDLASSRGAFKPDEMMFVGHKYTKLNNFLNAVQAAQQKSQTAQDSEVSE